MTQLDLPRQYLTELVAFLREALSESCLPILVDVLDRARIPDSFRKEIERAHVVLRQPAQETSS